MAQRHQTPIQTDLKAAAAAAVAVAEAANELIRLDFNCLAAAGVRAISVKR